MQRPDPIEPKPINHDWEKLAVACSDWETQASEATLARWLSERVDHDGSPKRLSPDELVEVVSRIDRAGSKRPGWSEGIKERLDGLIGWSIHTARPDGSAMLGEAGRDRLRLRTLHDAARRSGLPGFLTVLERWSPRHAGANHPGAPPPLPAISDDDRVFAVLRPDWADRGDWIAVDHREPNSPTRIELAGKGRPLLGPTWRSVGLEGRPGRPRPTTWTTGAFADHLEWSCPIGSTRVIRSATLLRYRDLAIIGQQEEGAKLSTHLSIDLPRSVVAAPVDESTAWTVTAGRVNARLIPLGLPPRPHPTEAGALRVESGSVELSGSDRGRRRWLPLVVAWGRPPSQWRTVTVTERSRACPPEVAFAARIGWGPGRDGLLIYRSLARPALRAVLGHQTRARFLVARFTPEGKAVPLLKID